MILAGDHAAPEAAIRFLGEAESVARLHHPNVVQVFAFGEHDGNPYFEMEYVAGGNLADRIDGTPWPARDAARMIETLARAIHEVHRLGIVHRDLKPANVLLATDGVPKIADFGLAKWLGVETGLTRTDHVLGSPSYMAPEQARGGSAPIGPAADVYALGAILHELLTGRPPFQAATALETLEQVKAAEPVAPARLRPGLPRDLETICLKCLRKEPARRYDSAWELAEDLGRFGAGEPIRARPVGAVERGWRWCRREPVRAGLAAGLALSLLGGLAGVATQWLRAEENVRRQREANEREGAALRRAGERFDAAMKAIRASENLAYGATLRREAHLDGLRRELLQTALGIYRELQESLEADASLEARSQLHAAYSRVANISKEFGLYDEALAAHRRALALVEQMASAAPADPEIRAKRAQRLEWIGGVLNLAGRPRPCGPSSRPGRSSSRSPATPPPILAVRRSCPGSWPTSPSPRSASVPGSLRPACTSRSWGSARPWSTATPATSITAATWPGAGASSDWRRRPPATWTRPWGWPSGRWRS
jgi:serine/threonine-protein kinase